MSTKFAPVRPYWLDDGETDKQAHQVVSGTVVPSRRAAPSQFAPTSNYWEEPSPAPRPATNKAAPGLLATVEYGRCGKPVGVAVMERAPRRETRRASHAVGPQFAPSVEYWREPGALATNAAAGWASVWNTVWNALRPGERAFAVNG